MANAKDIDIEKGMKILLYGPAGTGKTEFASTFPNPHFIDLDNGMLTVAGKDITYVTISQKKTTDPLFLDNVDKRYHDKCAYQKAVKMIEYWANKLTKDDTLIIDSWTFMNEFVMKFVLKLANQGTPRIQDWGAAQGLLIGILDQINDLECNVIIIAHTQFVKDENSGFVSWLPDTIGKLATKMSVFFDEVYLMSAERGKGADKDKVVYVTTTVPTRSTTAKTRLKLPNRIENCTYSKLIKLRGTRDK
jgi:hypothetical protein